MGIAKFAIALPSIPLKNRSCAISYNDFYCFKHAVQFCPDSIRFQLTSFLDTLALDVDDDLFVYSVNPDATITVSEVYRVLDGEAAVVAHFATWRHNDTTGMALLDHDKREKWLRRQDMRVRPSVQ